ncbi:hypothetical protein SB359474_4790 [Shigella boydii 3594-74]|uniref:Uncharacterized protein n=1 Tax=Shigella boydii 4444-74 TaxID=766140 RepID=I6DD99_SHIBO|nr:hypothetical protein SB359474_4790 [Shigella boydii 3594-74]EIQ29741.1 hypothetical protein SB444474_4940 [Shigella boydii 4444-74]QNC52107.1 hypothetical protein G5S54_02210 [Shigella boydii]QQT73020.1 hypothetical protein I6I96_13300 [Shigella boydii]
MELSRATLGRWTGAVAELLEPLYEPPRESWRLNSLRKR